MGIDEFYVYFAGTCPEMKDSWWTCGLATLLLTLCHFAGGARILMATMGGTKSHKIPFLALARGLISRGHNVTFVNAFPQDSEYPGLEEITPLNFVLYVKNYTNWDLLGMRMSGQEAVPPADVLRYGYYVSHIQTPGVISLVGINCYRPCLKLYILELEFTLNI